MATGVGFIILNHAGENGIILDMSANKLMDRAFVDQAEAQIADSDVVVSVLEIPAEAAIRAMELGHKHGVKTILNPAPAQPLPPDAFQYIDYLTPNETELRILLGLSPDDTTPTLELAQQLRGYGVGNLVVTMGGGGALILSEAGVETVPGVTVEVVDTTGAGDAFNSGLAVALAASKPLRQAVRYANCAGAIACTKLGVIPSLGTRVQVDQFYSENYEQ
jgi:ribokinase